MIEMTRKIAMEMEFVKMITPKMATAVTVRLASQEKTVKQVAMFINLRKKT